MPVVYRVVPGFPNYRVGDDGSVWSDIYYRRSNITGWTRMTPSPDDRGYLVVTIQSADGLRRCCHVHTLVLEAFVGLRPAGQQCRHFPDHDPANNSLGNLQWGTSAENHSDRVKDGRTIRGETHHMAKLTEFQVGQLRVMASLGTRHKNLATQFGVSLVTISRIVNGHAWKHQPTSRRG